MQTEETRCKIISLKKKVTNYKMAKHHQFVKLCMALILKIGKELSGYPMRMTSSIVLLKQFKFV